MKKLYYIRHGQSEMNLQGFFAGTTNTPLTAKGRKQAKKAGVAAKKLNIDYIVSSPLTRALDTAKIIAKEIGYPIDKIEINPLFIERNFGEMEGKTYSVDLDLDGVIGVERTDDLLARTKLALAYLTNLETDSVLVVSHGSFGRGLRHHLFEEFPLSHPHRIPNAEIVSWI